MENKKLGQEPAYPSEFDPQTMSFTGCKDIEFKKEYEKHTCGMSKRFYAACSAMRGLLANSTVASKLHEHDVPQEEQINSIIKASYEYADKLLEQENE